MGGDASVMLPLKYEKLCLAAYLLFLLLCSAITGLFCILVGILVVSKHVN